MKREAIKLSDHGLVVATAELRPLALVDNLDDKYASLHSAKFIYISCKNQFISASSDCQSSDFIEFTSHSVFVIGC